MSALQLQTLEVELQRAMRNNEDRVAFELIERIRLARKRLAAAQLQKVTA